MIFLMCRLLSKLLKSSLSLRTPKQGPGGDADGKEGVASWSTEARPGVCVVYSRCMLKEAKTSTVLRRTLFLEKTVGTAV